MKKWYSLKRIILLIFLSIHATFLVGQNFPFDVSENGKYYGYCFKVNKKDAKSALVQKNKKFNKIFEFRYYNVESQQLILKYHFQADKLSDIEIKVSPDGKTIAIIRGIPTEILSAQSKSIIYKSSIAQEVTFPNLDNSFAITFSKHIALFDTYTAKRLCSFDKASFSRGYGKVWFSEDDKFLIQQKSKNRFSLWNTNNPKRISSQVADAFSFDYKNNNLTFIRGLSIRTFSLEEMKMVHHQDVRSITREFIKKQKLQDRKTNIKFKEAVLSESGNFIIIPYSQDNKNSLLLCSSQREEYKEIPISGYEPVQFMEWQNDSLLLLHHVDNTITILNLFDLTDELHIDLDFSKRKYIQDKQILFPQDYSFYIKDINSIFKKRFLFNDLRSVQEIKLSNFEVVSISNSTNYLIVLNKKTNEHGVINPDEVFKKRNLAFTAFKDSIVNVVEPPYEERPPPDDYKPFKITGFKHISELKDTSELINLVLKNIEYSDSTISINTHLIDDNGIYYYGAASEEWKHIWCNLLMRKGKGQITQITDFDIIEHSINNSNSYGFAIIMDHSGSMGRIRALKIQQEVSKFLDKKNEDDGIALIKFDNRVGVESYFSKNSTELKKSLANVGLKGYGGGTSLLDATNSGISTYHNTHDYNEKSIVVLTDGFENSSFINKKDLIKRAIKDGVNLYMIGFGYSVDKKYLQSITNPTGGTYYEIYSTKDFEWIFADIDNKIKNYYEIKFCTDTITNHRAVLKICLTDKHKDTLSVSVKNQKFNPNDENGENGIVELDQTSLEYKEFMSIDDLKDFSSINTYSSFYFDSLKRVDEIDSLTQEIEVEFEKFDLPNIKFEVNSTTILDSTLIGIDDLSTFLKKFKNVNVEIEGHTDSEGDEISNMELSIRRAEKIKGILISSGIDESRIVAKGFGELFPIVENSNEENKQINRRVEFIINY